jgi:hypothetical protein
MGNFSNLYTVGLGAFFLLTSSRLYYSWRESFRKIDALNNLSQKCVTNIESLRGLKKGETKLVKAKIDADQLWGKEVAQEKVPISYNQYFLEEPADAPIIRAVAKKEPFTMSRFTITDASQTKIEVNGIKKIAGDVYYLQKEFELKPKAGVFSKLWRALAYCPELIINYIRKAKFSLTDMEYIPEVRTPFFSGPLFGFLHYSIGLMADTFFVLEIGFEDGEYNVEVLANSYFELIESYEQSIWESKQRTFKYLILALLFGWGLYSRLEPSLRKVLAFDNVLDIDNLPENKQCIICYTHCRNILAFDCKHLIMCYNCANSMRDQTCPICKKPVTRCKPILNS